MNYHVLKNGILERQIISAKKISWHLDIKQLAENIEVIDIIELSQIEWMADAWEYYLRISVEIDDRRHDKKVDGS